MKAPVTSNNSFWNNLILYKMLSHLNELVILCLEHRILRICKIQISWKYISYTILCPWFRASWLCISKIQQDATVCRYLYTASLLYMFRVSSAPSWVQKTVTAAFGTGHSNGATTFLRGLIRPCWRKVVALLLWPVPKTAITVNLQ